MAIDNTNQLIVLSFRGSRTLGNYITDSKYQQVPAICPGCQVHKGYYWAWGNFSAFIMQPINQLAAIYPSYQIVFTGHSSGGALATLGAALEGGNPSRPIDLVSTSVTANVSLENALIRYSTLLDVPNWAIMILLSLSLL